MSVVALNVMDDTKKVSAYPKTTFPIISKTTPPIIANHHTISSSSFNIENLSHYLNLIMSVAYKNPTKNVLTSISSGTSAFQEQVRAIDQLATANLFDNAFLVVSMAISVDNMAYKFAHFIYRIMDGLNSLPNVGQGTTPLYANMITLLLTGQHFDQANTMGIIPDLEISPSQATLDSKRKMFKNMATSYSLS
jgi:hypothetical protein